jgi:hypothetical protein
MNRRQFVSRVSLGAAAACTTFAKPSLAEPSPGQLNLRFVGMMGFIQRADRSFLVATPGQHGTHHMTHVPFLMARKGSRIAAALGFAPVSGVVPEAFDTALIDSRPEDFVFRSLSNTAVDVVSGSDDAVVNEATEMAQMNRIAPGKRVRGNIEKWAASTISLRGGRVEDSHGHPDAGKVWTFGSHKQRLTDAVNFRNLTGDSTSIRLTGATDARSYKIPAGESVDLWMFSAATMAATGGNPTRLAHSELLFEYLVDANPVYAECPEATGRPIPTTEVPFVNPSSAGLNLVASETVFPPESELCYLAVFL